MPSENSRRLRPEQVDAARALLETSKYDRVRIAANASESYAISRDRAQLQDFMAALAGVDQPVAE